MLVRRMIVDPSRRVIQHMIFTQFFRLGVQNKISEVGTDEGS